MLSNKCLWIKNSWIILQNKVELQTKADTKTLTLKEMFPNTNIVKQKAGGAEGKEEGRNALPYKRKEIERDF